jgi:hypothetical protein
MAKRIGPNCRKKAAQRKARHRPIFKTAAIVLLLVVAGGAGGLVARQNYGMRLVTLVKRYKEFREPQIARVVVKGSIDSNCEELLKRSGITFPVSIGDLKNGWLKKMAAMNPWIEKIRLEKTARGTATVTIRERTPVALVNKGSVWLVDREGIFLPVKHGVSYALPLISGLHDSIGGDGVHRLFAADRDRISKLYDDFNASDTAFVNALTQIRFGDDGILTLSLSGTPTVITINEAAASEGLARLARIWPLVMKFPDPPRSIDCSFRNIAFVVPGDAARVADARGGDARKNKG